jgi:hypothetical protein
LRMPTRDADLTFAHGPWHGHRLDANVLGTSSAMTRRRGVRSADETASKRGDHTDGATERPNARRPDRLSRRSALVLFSVLAPIVLDVATDTPSTRGHWLGPFLQLVPATQTTSTICAALLTLLTLGMVFGKSDHLAVLLADMSRFRWQWLLPIAPMVCSFFWTRPFVPTDDALYWNAMVVTAPLLIVALIWARCDPIYVASVVASVGFVLRLVHFSEFSIDEGADMLPLVRSGVARFVASQNPYRYYDLPAPLPLTYYPITWLAYVPPYVCHVDLRWTNLIAEVSIPGALLYANSHDIRGRDLSGPSSPSPRTMRLGLLAWAIQFMLPSSIYFDRITTAPVAWALITWCLVLTVRAPAYSWVALALTAGATPLAAIMAPAIFVFWWKRRSLKAAVLATVKAGLLTAAVLAPFVFWSPQGFLDGAVLWFNDLSRYPGTTWRAYRPWARYVGFGGMFWSAGLEHALAPIQWGLVATVTTLFARRAPSDEAFASHVAAAFVAFMLFNSVHWPYFFQPAICAAFVALTFTSSTSVATPSP